MKSVVFFLISLVVEQNMAMACDAKAALLDYYQGPTNAVVTISGGSKGVFNISIVEEDGAVCKGAQAYVNSSCEVVVVKAAFCRYEN